MLWNLGIFYWKNFAFCLSSVQVYIPRFRFLYFLEVSSFISVWCIYEIQCWVYLGFLASRTWKISRISTWMVFYLTHLNSPHAHTLLLYRDIWKAAVASAISYRNRGLKNSNPEFVISIQISSNQHRLHQWFSGSSLIIINAAFLLFWNLNNILGFSLTWKSKISLKCVWRRARGEDES